MGRTSGEPRRIEIWWFRVDGRFVITGTPGPRDWYANVLSNPAIVVHVDGLDLEATAVPISNQVFRRVVFTQPETSWYSSMAQLEDLVAAAAMIEVVLDR